MSFAKTTNQYYASGALTAMGGLGPPTLQSALTKHVAKEEVGRLLGALSLLGSMSRVVSPTVLNLLYSFTVATCPQTIFYVLSGAMCVGFILSWGVRAHGNNTYKVVAKEQCGSMRIIIEMTNSSLGLLVFGGRLGLFVE